MPRQITTVFMIILIAMSSTILSLPQAHATPPVSPYAGLWSGTFTTNGPNGAFGYVTFDIGDNGLITGSATYYLPGVGAFPGITQGHVNQAGFGAFIFHGSSNVIPYLLFVSINGDGDLVVVAPVPWNGGFTVFATLHRH